MIRLTALAVCLCAGAAFGQQASREVVATDATGTRVDRVFVPQLMLGEDGATSRAGLLWTYNDAASITESVALGDGGRESWVAHSLNDKRMSKFTTTGGGVPDFVYSLAMQMPDTIGVAAAADGTLCAMIEWRNSALVTVRGFAGTGTGTPLWSFTYNGTYTNSGKRAVAVSGNGMRVATCAFDGTDTLLVLHNGATGAMMGSATIPGYCSGVEMDDSGTRILVTAGSVARLYDTATMTEVYSLATSGAGGYHRISRDGTAIAAGGFNIRAAREIGGVWQTVYAGGGSTDWFGWGMSLSGDGETLFVLSHDYGDGYLTNEHRIVDLTTGTVVAVNSYTGSGSFQNSAVAAQTNDDGTIFAAASWGDAGNTEPEVRIFDRDLNMIGSIDTAGSPFELDMSRDGRYVLVGSKAVHANTFGNGGNTYAYENDSLCVADFNGDGTVNTQDVLAFLNAWTSDDPSADINGDGSVNTQDVIMFLNLWNAGC
ncbi:MAG: GC-type dockerin domain-anchored protein [Planctomycetota bacterium]|nr:GC-type dockerin domain-anchored protein [Planctomycetota bacterium]